MQVYITKDFGNQPIGVCRLEKSLLPEGWLPNYILAPSLVKNPDGTYELISLSLIPSERYTNPASV